MNIFSIRGVKETVSSLFKIEETKYTFIQTRFLKPLFGSVKNALLSSKPDLFAESIILKVTK